MVLHVLSQAEVLESLSQLLIKLGLLQEALRYEKLNQHGQVDQTYLMDTCMRDFTSLLHKQVPDRNGKQKSNNSMCTYGTG